MFRIELRGNKDKVRVVSNITGMKDMLAQLLVFAGYNRGVKETVFYFTPVRNEEGTPGHQGLSNISVRLASTDKNIVVRVQPGNNETCWSFNVNVPTNETQQTFLERLQKAVEKASLPKPKKTPTKKTKEPSPNTTTCVVKALEDAQLKRQNILDLITLHQAELDKFGEQIKIRETEASEAENRIAPHRTSVEEAEDSVRLLQGSINELEQRINKLLEEQKQLKEQLVHSQTVYDAAKTDLEGAVTNHFDATDRVTEVKNQANLEHQAIDDLETQLETLDQRITHLMEDQRRVLLNQAKSGLSADERRKLAAELLEGLEP